MERQEIIDRLKEAHRQLSHFAPQRKQVAEVAPFGRLIVDSDLALADIARCIAALEAENPPADPRPKPTTREEAEAAGAQWYRDVTEGDTKA